VQCVPELRISGGRSTRSRRSPTISPPRLVGYPIVKNACWHKRPVLAGERHAYQHDGTLPGPSVLTLWHVPAFRSVRVDINRASRSLRRHISCKPPTVAHASTWLTPALAAIESRMRFGGMRCGLTRPTGFEAPGNQYIMLARRGELILQATAASKNAVVERRRVSNRHLDRLAYEAKRRVLRSDILAARADSPHHRELLGSLTRLQNNHSLRRR
jgi:hypothetical protein